MQKKSLELKGKQITVFGIKKSGIAAMELLLTKGASVFATEREAEIASESIVWMEENGIAFELGFHSRKCIEDKDLIVISPGVNPTMPILQEARKLGTPIIGEIELAWHFSNARFLALTGTSGKSTCVELIGSILSRHLPHVFVCGNIGIPISRIILDNPGVQLNLVVEVSSFQLETIRDFKPELAVFINFNEDHLDRYASLDDYFQAKCRIFENQDAQDLALLNYDDPKLRNLAIPASKVVYYSNTTKLENGCYFDNEAITICTSENTNHRVPLEGFRLKGLHNRSNAIAAVAAACLFLKDQFSVSRSHEALRQFNGLEHRFEWVGTHREVIFINDSKSTKPQTTQVALECLNQPTILILGGSDKGNDFFDLAKTIAAHPKIKMVVITGKTQKKIKHTFDALSYKKYKLTPSFKSAVFEALIRSRPGDLVLLSPACASFDEFKGFEHRGQVYKELIQNSFRSGC